MTFSTVYQPVFGRVIIQQHKQQHPQDCYPTPPASPDLIDSILSFPTPDKTFIESQSPPPTPPPPVQVETKVATATPAIPIPILLNTHHTLPHASTLRLTTSQSILGALGGNRVLKLDSFQTVWDRMPYSAATATHVVRTPTGMEEDKVEAMLGGLEEKVDMKRNGIHWSLRNSKPHDHMSSIFIHPPTPERMSPADEQPPPSIETVAGSSKIKPDQTPSTIRETSPAPNTSMASLPIAMHVLPEVRSPPRRTIAMAADSLQINPRRGRRPRLFGFTEMPESSSSSANSSRDTSRHNSPSTSRQGSPERVVSPLVPPPLGTFSPSSVSSSSTITPHAVTPVGNFIPRRQPVRARSETSLPTAASISTTTPLSPTITPPRRRDNGLKLDFAGIIPVRTASEIQNSIVPSPYSAKLIRKKSGEILKPALKYGGPLGPNGTPLEAPIQQQQRAASPAPQESQSRPRFESKSCPSTPSCPKYVHFDAQLERVKLFLHDQKPQVVSRTGSPTTDYTTSEGEEYPFPSTDEERDEKRVLQVKLPNFPTSHPPDADLFLESLFLDDDRKTLKGVVQVKNLAFQKWVAVRFTLDWWQTTSEVTATHKDSVKGGVYDRFAFQVKLADILNKIEEKTLFLAIRYNTDGREIWDSNGGSNYQVLFEKVLPEPKRVQGRRGTQAVIQPGMGRAVGGRTSQWSVTNGQEEDRMADLRAKLSALTADDLGNSPPQLSPNGAAAGPGAGGGGGSRHSFSFSPRKNNNFGPPSPSMDGPSNTSGGPGSPRRSDNAQLELPVAGPTLAARYDFGTALKTSGKGRPASNSPNGRVMDLPDVRTELIQFGMDGVGGTKRNDGHAAMEFYSPRFSPNSQVNGLPHTHGNANANDYFFSPPTASPMTISSPTVPDQMAVPDLSVEGPSPPVMEVSSSVFASSVTNQKPIPNSELDSEAMGNRATPQDAITTALPHTTTPIKSVSISDMSDGMVPSPPPPVLSHSNPESVTDTPSDSPKSLPDVSLPRWSPTARLRVGVGIGEEEGEVGKRASYSSFLEQFCWGGVTEPLKRSHSASSLEDYFAHPHGHAADGERNTPTPTPTVATMNGNGNGHSGISTPRARPLISPNGSDTATANVTQNMYRYNGQFTPREAGREREGSREKMSSTTTSTPSSANSSYYSSYSGQSTPGREEVDNVEDVLGGLTFGLGGSGRSPVLC